ncbi:ParA family protein [Larkinella insperata]|uniref:ParA family protein n=1 Tax=Larkinella insperata TaxID=332158 RepID=A0ABW3Q6M9_9BACT
MMASASPQRKPTVLAFATQKGGMGKTTLSVIVSSYLHYKRGLKTALLDVDGSQLSVHTQRMREADQLDEEGHARMEERSQKEGIDPYEILSGYPKDVPKMLTQIDEDTEIVFVDLPGNIDVEGYDTAVKSVDVLFVPMETSEYSVTTGFQYLNAIKQIGLVPIENCWVVWNKYKPSRDLDMVAQLEESFASYGLQALKSRIPQRDSYQDPANRSTLFPMPTNYLRNSGLKELFIEVEEIIVKHRQLHGQTI